MSLSAPTDSDDAVAQQASKRWVADADGRTIYYPYGQMYGGYLVTDPECERAIREADRPFDEASNNIAQFAYVLVLPVIYVYYYFSSSHPVLALAVFPATLALLGLLAWLVRRPRLEPLLAGLAPVPPADVAARKLRYKAAYVLLVIGGLFALVLHLYDQRVAAASVDSKTTDFYPDISQYLIYASFSALMSWSIIASSSKLSARFGQARTLLATLILVVLGLIPAGMAISTFSEPRPRIKLSELALSCENWGMGWFQITNVTLRSGSRGRQYAELEYDDGAPHLDRLPSESCEIDGLNADYTEVYDVIYKGWQAGKAAWSRELRGGRPMRW
jgi:hypothetical protein